MTYELDLTLDKAHNYIVIDDDNPEELSAFKRILNLPENTTEIRLYGISAEYFVEENPG